MVNVLAIVFEVCGLKPGQGDGFKSDKNLQHTFLQRGKKAVGPCCKILQKKIKRMNKDISKVKLIISFTKFLLICY
jgi:hypothetical protein